MAAMAIALVASVILVLFYEPAAASGSSGEYNASHILIKFAEADPSGVSQRTREEALELADEIYEKASEKDANFADLARTYSEDTSATRGGQLGNFTPEKMIPIFSQTTMGLQIGEISEPIESQYGFHIILRTELD